MNDGVDVQTLMREVVLPPELEVGQGYGKVSWDVRAIWETYAGMVPPRLDHRAVPLRRRARADRSRRVGGRRRRRAREAQARIEADEPLVAISLAEAVLVAEPNHPDARAVMVAARRDPDQREHELLGDLLVAPPNCQDGAMTGLSS